MLDHPTVTYEEWRLSAIFVTDLRPLEKKFDGLDGYDFWRCDKPVPGALFFYNTPVGDVDPINEQHWEGPDYHSCGVVQQLDDGRWYVIVGNEQPTFACFETAARWLWEQHWKCEIGTPEPVEPLFRLIAFGIDGATKRDETGTMTKIESVVHDDFGDDADRAANCLIDLRDPDGDGVHKFSQGRYVLIPIEEEV